MTNQKYIRYITNQLNGEMFSSATRGISRGDVMQTANKSIIMWSHLQNSTMQSSAEQPLSWSRVWVSALPFHILSTITQLLLVYLYLGKWNGNTMVSTVHDMASCGLEQSPFGYAPPLLPGPLRRMANSRDINDMIFHVYAKNMLLIVSGLHHAYFSTTLPSNSLHGRPNHFQNKMYAGFHLKLMHFLMNVTNGYSQQLHL